MYWYGWIVTSAIVAAAAGLIASFLPENFGRRLWSGFAWLIPVCAIAAIIHLLGGYFTH
jgi:MFS family permease